MSALTADRNTPRMDGDFRSGPVAAGQVIFAGALVCRNAAGDLVKGAVATGLVGVGRAEARADNTGGAAGEIELHYRVGIFSYENAAGADALGKADVGGLCYVLDDQTVAKTNGGGTRSKAGFVDAITPTGVLVRLDEALTNAT